LRRVGKLLFPLSVAAAVVLGASAAAIAILDAGESGNGEMTRPGQASETGAAEREVDTAPRAAEGRGQSVARPLAQVWRQGASASWAALSRSVSAQIGLATAPLGSGPVRSFGSLQLGHAWSSIKVPILVTVMRAREGRGLSAEEMELAREALTASDNAAAASLFGRIEEERGGLAAASLAVQLVLRKAGDGATTIATDPPPSGAVSTYGQSEWSLSASVEFVRALARGCLLDDSGTEYVLGLMGEVTPEQRWGLGEAGFPSRWQVAMKGGWGPEGSAEGPYLVRQEGVVREGGSGVAVAMMARASSGSFADGVDAVTRIAGWLRENLHGLGTPADTRRC
jgi:hypothetical protein